jgi:hypothetical protein
VFAHEVSRESGKIRISDADHLRIWLG